MSVIPRIPVTFEMLGPEAFSSSASSGTKVNDVTCTYCRDTFAEAQGDTWQAHKISGQEGYYHPVHEKCLNVWKRVRFTCPLCNDPIQPSLRDRLNPLNYPNTCGTLAYTSLMTALSAYFFFKYEWFAFELVGFNALLHAAPFSIPMLELLQTKLLKTNLPSFDTIFLSYTVSFFSMGELLGMKVISFDTSFPLILQFLIFSVGSVCWVSSECNRDMPMYLQNLLTPESVIPGFVA